MNILVYDIERQKENEFLTRAHFRLTKLFLGKYTHLNNFYSIQKGIRPQNNNFAFSYNIIADFVKSIFVALIIQ